MKKFKLEPLPFSYNALEPVISKETLKYHHDKHHQAYVDKLNELLPRSGFEGLSLEELVAKTKGPLFNQAAQHWNHDFYWKSMNPIKKAVPPEGKLLSGIKRDFGSLKKFKDEFK